MTQYILGLPGLRVCKVHPAEPDSEDPGSRLRRVEVDTALEQTACPVCGSERLYKHGVRVQRYMDAPHYGEPATLVVNRRRWRCRDCKTLFPDPLPDIDEKRRATTRLVKWVQSQSIKRTFAEISRDCGLSDSTVRHIFDDFVEEMERKFHFVTPRWLGIDEVKLMGEYRCILTNVEKNTIFDLMSSRKMDFLRKYFSTFPDPKDVEVFSTDLWNNYATIAREYFPDAALVADRFHIQRMATNSMEAVRKEVRKSLARKERLKLKDDRFLLLKHSRKLSDQQRIVLDHMHFEFPTLQQAWQCKEDFFAIWDAQDRHTANEAMDAWVSSVPPEVEGKFSEAINALKTRREHILNYFDYRITNAYTESIKRLAKSLVRVGRGYSLEVVRAKLLYDTNALEKGTMGVRVPEWDFGTGFTASGRGSISGVKYRKETVCYGAHIPTLCEKLEAGDFES